jgi:hypothetical protein
MRAVLLAILLAGVATAGCGGSPAEGPIDAQTEDLVEDLELEVTPTTGLLLGIVVDERVVPIAGATVALGSGETTNTSADGAYGFDGLQPGTHLVTASKPGYVANTVSAVVVVGDKDPPLVNVQLQASLDYVAPFVDAYKVDGYIMCTSNPVALCSLPNNYRPTACGTHESLCYDNVTEDNSRFNLELVGNTSALQAELVWDAASRFSQQMGWKAEPNVGCDGVGGTNQLAYGPSPLLAIGIEPKLRTPGGPPCGVIIAVSGGTITDGACVPDVPLFGTLCPGVVVQQQFAAYVHAFYGHLPPPGWRFAIDGPPPQP